MNERVKTGVFWVCLSTYVILVFGFPDNLALKSAGILVVAVPSLLAELLFLAFKHASLTKDKLRGELIYAVALLIACLFGVYRFFNA